VAVGLRPVGLDRKQLLAHLVERPELAVGQALEERGEPAVLLPARVVEQLLSRGRQRDAFEQHLQLGHVAGRHGRSVPLVSDTQTNV